MRWRSRSTSVDLHDELVPDRHDVLWPLHRSFGQLGVVDQPFEPVLFAADADERTEGNQFRDAPRDDLTDARHERRQRVLQQRLPGEGDPLPGEIHIQDLYGDLLADFDDIGVLREGLPGQFGGIDHALRAADVDEHAVGGDRGDGAGTDLAAGHLAEGGPADVARCRIRSPPGPEHTVLVRQHGGEQRLLLALVDEKGHGPHCSGAGQLCSQDGRGRLMGDEAADSSGRVRHDELDAVLVGKRAEHGIDVRGQEVRPHSQPRARSESGPDVLDTGAGDAVPAGGIPHIPFFKEQRPAPGYGQVQELPEVVVGRPLFHGLVLEVRDVGGRFYALREQSPCAGTGHSPVAGLAAGHVDILVVPDVYGKCALRLQSAPGSVVAEHGPDEFQSDRDGYLRPVVVTGQAGREESGQAVSGDRSLQAEVDVPGDPRFPDRQVVDSGVLGERGHRLQIGGLDRPVVTDRVLGTGVPAVCIAVGGIVLGDPVAEWVGAHGASVRRASCRPHRSSPPHIALPPRRRQCIRPGTTDSGGLGTGRRRSCAVSLRPYRRRRR